MSFREKSAWITLVTVLLCFGVYFGAIISGVVYGFHGLYLLLGCVAALVLLQFVLGRIAALTTPSAEREVRDERELLIQGRSHSLGYYVLTLLSLSLFIPVHFGHSAIDMANFALLNVVLTTLAVSAAQIVMFRRGI